MPTGKLKTVSSMAPDIIQKNVRSWDTLELSTILVSLLRTAGSIIFGVLPGGEFD